MSERIGPGGEGYSKAFYGEIAGGSGRSAEIVLPIVFGLAQPGTVVDVGCGVGAWLRVARSLGAHEVLGFDGDHVPTDMLEIERKEFRAVDLAEPLSNLPRRFDLAISLEVAEHLPAERSDSFVSDLCGLADLVLFSAAIPYQGGQDHINEQWPSQWAARFIRHGYQAFDIVRPLIWRNSEVEVWYRQNIVLFVNGNRADLLEAASRAASSRSPDVLDLVHPFSWERLSRMAGSQPSLRYSLMLTARAAKRAAVVRLRRRPPPRG